MEDIFKESGLLERGDDVVNCVRDGVCHRYRIVKRIGVVKGVVVYPGEYVVMHKGELERYSKQEFLKHYKIIKPK